MTVSSYFSREWNTQYAIICSQGIFFLKGAGQELRMAIEDSWAGSFNNINWNTSNCCDVSFERPFITSHPRARSYASRERKLWWKKFKIKRFPSGCDEIWDSRSIEGKDKLSTDPLTAILASLDHLYGIYGASSWNGRLQSPNLPIFLTVGYNLISQTSIKRLPNGSRGEETVNNKTQTQGKSFLYLFLSKIGM